MLPEAVFKSCKDPHFSSQSPVSLVATLQVLANVGAAVWGALTGTGYFPTLRAYIAKVRPPTQMKSYHGVGDLC